MIIKDIAQKIIKFMRYGKNAKYCIMRGSRDSRKGLKDLIDAIETDHPLRIVEVGSYSGESAQELLSTGKVDRIYCIDPWEDRNISGDGNDYHGMQSVERCFEERFSNNRRVVKCKGTLKNYLNHCWYDIDLVYIDALHTYDACKEDISNALRYIKPRYIGGHDYTKNHTHTIGVFLAVNEIFGQPDKIFCDTSWIKKLR